MLDQPSSSNKSTMERQSDSSMPNVDMPPLTKFGLGALARFDQPGYHIGDSRQEEAARVSSLDPEGYTTDFYLDPKQGGS